MMIPVRVKVALPVAVLMVIGIALFVMGEAADAFGVVPGKVETTAVNRDGTLDFQAGSHPYAYTVSFEFKQNAEKKELEGQARDIEVDLPPGLVGNPDATPRCSREDFENSFPQCPGDTQIGWAEAQVEGFTLAESPVYNLVPPPGVPARFGFSAANNHALADASVRTGSDYGVTVTDNNIPTDLKIESVSETIWGVPAEESHDFERYCTSPHPGLESDIKGCHSDTAAKPFLTLPTSCTGPLTTTVRADSVENPGVFESESAVSLDAGGNPFGLVGCEKLAFDPSISLEPDTTSAESPSGLNVNLEVPQEESTTGLAEANLREAVVKLPAGMTVSPSAANGLEVCTLQEIELEGPRAPSCPDSSKIGKVEIETPLLEAPLQGSVFVAQQGNLPGIGSNPFGSLFALYLVAEGDGALVKLPGKIELDEEGQLTARFGEDPLTRQFLPQLPFSDLKMSIFGGHGAPLMTPAGCGSYTASSVLAPWSGTPPVSSLSDFTIDQGCSQGFAPSFSGGTSNNQAGAYSSFGVTFARQDREQRFSGVQVTTPPGLLGDLKSVVQCPEPQAGKGECGPGSLIGEATTAVGPGEDPYWVKGGRVYLTGPYNGGPFGLSIVVPTTAGPFTLTGNGGPGREIVRSSIRVDPHTTQITVVSDPLPSILQGVPLDVRTINVTIDRPGFMFNPTDCAPLNLTGMIISSNDTVADVSSPFEAANCANLQFKPSLAVSAAAKTSKADGASLLFKIKAGSGQANTAKLRITFPKQLPARLTTLQKACVDKVFDTNPAACPAASAIGTATVHTPVLANPLTGPIYLVSHGGAAFPDAVIVLQGEGITVYLDANTNIKKGITSSTFNSVPDAPFSTVEATLPQGPHSAFATDIPTAAKGSMCGQKLTMPTAFTGQNGVFQTRTTKIVVTGCPKKTKQKTKARNKQHKHKK
jgi:hypothetical protein